MKNGRYRWNLLNLKTEMRNSEKDQILRNPKMGNNTVKLMENNIINALLPAVLSKQKKALQSKKALPGQKKCSLERT
jgi:hypothetical protein